MERRRLHERGGLLVHSLRVIRAYLFVVLCYYLVRTWGRKHQGCNVAAYDINIGEVAKKPNAMDFLSNSGFLPVSQSGAKDMFAHALFHFALARV